MRTIGLVLACLAMAAPTVWSQDADPQPDKDGVYVVLRGIMPPRLIQGEPAAYPTDPAQASQKHVCALTLVIGADGLPAKIELANSDASPFDDAAVAAVKASEFAPATLEKKPVPVYAFVLVPFLGAGQPATPVLVGREPVPGMTMPRPLNRVEPEYSDEARRARVSGDVLVKLMVNEEGRPASIQVVRPVGKGLDEQAVKAAKRYRFTPATYEGIPVPSQIMAEISFRLLN